MQVEEDGRLRGREAEAAAIARGGVRSGAAGGVAAAGAAGAGDVAAPGGRRRERRRCGSRRSTRSASIARAPLTRGRRPAADQGARSLRPGDPRRGGAGDRPARSWPSAGDALIKAINDSQADVRYASMRALGAIREARAVGALTEQLDVLQARARARGRRSTRSRRSARRPACRSSRSGCRTRIPTSAGPRPKGSGRAGDAASIDALETQRRRPTTSPMVRLRQRVRAAEARAQLRGAAHRPDEFVQGGRAGAGIPRRARSADGADASCRASRIPIRICAKRSSTCSARSATRRRIPALEAASKDSRRRQSRPRPSARSRASRRGEPSR